VSTSQGPLVILVALKTVSEGHNITCPIARLRRLSVSGRMARLPFQALCGFLLHGFSALHIAVLKKSSPDGKKRRGTVTVSPTSNMRLETPPIVPLLKPYFMLLAPVVDACTPSRQNHIPTHPEIRHKPCRLAPASGNNNIYGGSLERFYLFTRRVLGFFNIL